MHDYKKEFWTTDKTPNAKQIRDSRAKQLRKEGYTVTTNKLNFSDLARCTYYGLEAEKQVCDKCGTVTDYLIPYNNGVRDMQLCIDCAAKTQHTQKPIVNSDGSLAHIRHIYGT